MNPLDFVLPGIGTAIGAVGDIFKFVNASKQNDLANKLEAKYPRPTRDVMPAITQEGDIYRNLATQQQAPWQQTAQDQIGQNAANSAYGIAQTAQSPSQTIAGLGGLNANTNAALHGLATDAAKYHYTNLLNLSKYLGTDLAGEQEKNFNMNQYLPYQQATQTASALRGAAMQNQFGGTEGLSNLFMNLVGGINKNRMADQNKPNLSKYNTSNLTGTTDDRSYDNPYWQ
jgi:hypothetical protein